jgi:hypothetical protein
MHGYRMTLTIAGGFIVGLLIGEAAPRRAGRDGNPAAREGRERACRRPGPWAGREGVAEGTWARVYRLADRRL